MKRLLPHEERRTRHGFGMSGFPVDKEKSGRLGQMRKGEVVQSHESNQLDKQPIDSLYIIKCHLMALKRSDLNVYLYPLGSLLTSL